MSFWPLAPACRSARWPNLQDHLAAHPQTDFIESVTTADVGWTVGGPEPGTLHLALPLLVETAAPAV